MSIFNPFELVNRGINYFGGGENPGESVQNIINRTGDYVAQGLGTEEGEGVFPDEWTGGYPTKDYFGTKIADEIRPYVNQTNDYLNTIPTNEQFTAGVDAQTLEDQKNPGFKGFMQRFLPGGETGYAEGAEIPEGPGAEAYKKMGGKLGGLFDFVGDIPKPSFQGFGGASERLKAMLGNNQQRTYLPPVQSSESPFYQG